VVGILLLDQEVTWYVLFIRQWNDLSQSIWLASLTEVNSVSINDHVLSKILISVEASRVWARWLVDRPVVEWWVPDWVLGVGLNQVVSIDSINDEISQFQVLVSSIS